MSRKAPEKGKGCLVWARVPIAVRVQILERAEREGLSMSAFIRRLVLRELSAGGAR